MQCVQEEEELQALKAAEELLAEESRHTQVQARTVAAKKAKKRKTKSGKAPASTEDAPKHKDASEHSAVDPSVSLTMTGSTTATPRDAAHSNMGKLQQGKGKKGLEQHTTAKDNGKQDMTAAADASAAQPGQADKTAAVPVQQADVDSAKHSVQPNTVAVSASEQLPSNQAGPRDTDDQGYSAQSQAHISTPSWMSGIDPDWLNSLLCCPLTKVSKCCLC